MKRTTKITVILVILLNAIPIFSNAQTVPQGINYQGVARNANNAILTNRNMDVKVGIHTASASGTLEWEETHSITTNSLGLFYFVIGQGTSTAQPGTLPSFSSINWGAANHFVSIALDTLGNGLNYLNIDTVQFWTVPYAMYSGSTAGSTIPLWLNQLTDVDTAGVQTGYVLKYNGSIWVPKPDLNSDTALYADSAYHSQTTVYAQYALNAMSTVDTVLYSQSSDSASYATNSVTSIHSDSSHYCDTALYALSSGTPTLNAWNLTGNTGTNPATNFVGTIDNKDLVFRTNNTERMRITSGGSVGIGIVAPTASLHIAGNNGLLAEGTFGSGTATAEGAGTRLLWYPKKAAFRAGTVTTVYWTDANIGNYSFASGYNSEAKGDYSTAVGNANLATGAYSFAEGQTSTASGLCSISMGQNNFATGPYSVAFPRMATASDTGSIAIGYHNFSKGKNSLCFGVYDTASGDFSTAMGFGSNTNHQTGSFVYGDYSTDLPTQISPVDSLARSTAPNQFIVRATGGVYFYTQLSPVMGIQLAAGSGSWTSVSDKHKKEHFKNEDGFKALKKLETVEVTSWNYKSQAPSIRHIGPMAQDLYAAFHFGESDTTITTVDIEGISLLAIKALDEKTKELKQKADEVEKLEAQVAALESDKKKLEKRISSIEKQLNLPAPATVTTAAK